MGVIIRAAEDADLADLNAIYNHYVRTSTATFATSEMSLAERQAWFAGHRPNHPVLVGVEDRQLVGWACLSPYSPREAYAGTVEDSVYVRPERHGAGIGGQLLEAVLEVGAEAGFREVIAKIEASQAPSLALHARHGFVHRGRFERVGYKFGRWLDTDLLQRTLQ